jgi:archaellum biogenesis ATPase FlaH
MIAIRTANDRIKAGLQLPDIYSLIGDIWQSGELAILFGGTGSGKSILSVQIADVLSKGENLFSETINESPPQVVIYFDFELTDKQFQIRYTNLHNNKSYQFSDYLKIVNIPFGEIYEPGKNITAKIFDLIEKCLVETDATVLIIDNITALSSEDNKDANTALEIMSYLDKLKRNNGLSILVVAHTPKKFSFTPITLSDLAGSSKIANFSDTIFAIGKSIINTEFRYLIQVKFSRSRKEGYDYNNVITLRKSKDDNFLHFEFEGTIAETEHISKEGNNPKLTAISMKNQGASLQEIADKLIVSKTTAHNWTKNEKGHRPFERPERIEHMNDVNDLNGLNGMNGMNEK